MPASLPDAAAATTTSTCSLVLGIVACCYCALLCLPFYLSLVYNRIYANVSCLAWLHVEYAASYLHYYKVEQVLFAWCMVLIISSGIDHHNLKRLTASKSLPKLHCSAAHVHSTSCVVHGIQTQFCGQCLFDPAVCILSTRCRYSCLMCTVQVVNHA